MPRTKFSVSQLISEAFGGARARVEQSQALAEAFGAWSQEGRTEVTDEVQQLRQAWQDRWQRLSEEPGG